MVSEMVVGGVRRREDYDWVDDYHTHSRRRDAILRRHPEIRRLMVHDPGFKWKVLTLVATQCVSFYLLSGVDSFWPLLLIGYFFGGVINHSLTLAIHDISHNQAFGYGRPLANRLFGMIANCPLGVPTSITFRKYHEDHHKYLGKRADTDVPTEWEGRFFNTAPRKTLWLVLNPLFYAIRPIVVSPKSIEPLEVLNLAIQLAFDVTIGTWCGWHVVGYMIMSTFVCTGLHPMAGHFLTEHYVYFYEQDYLDKLAAHHDALRDKLLVPETFSYYGPFNAIAFNVGYHVEHHDFPSIPSSLLPKVREMAPEFYEPLCSHTSWIKALLRYIFDPRMNPFARIRRRELYNEYMNSNNNNNDNNNDIKASSDCSAKEKEVESSNDRETDDHHKCDRNRNTLNIKLSQNQLIIKHYAFYE